MSTKLVSTSTLLTLVLSFSCGSINTYQLLLGFQDQTDRDAVAEVNVWALKKETSCLALTSGSTTPEQLDSYSKLEINKLDDSSIELSSIPTKDFLVFAEAKNQAHITFLRGCIDVNIVAGDMNIIVEMRRFCIRTADEDIPNNQKDDDCDGRIDECDPTDTDTDSDGTPDCSDECPHDPAKLTPGICGCGTADKDTDGDTTPDCQDACPSDENKIAPGICDCGRADIDEDNNGIIDCIDPCAGAVDSDADGVCDPLDQCNGDDNSGDFDGDGECNDLDTDDDNDTWSDADESICGTDPLLTGSQPVDSDGDNICDALDQCTGDDISGDTDNNGTCNNLDPDDDGDMIEDVDDWAELDSTRCIDTDFDGCDDCSSGIFDTENDGVDTDADGRCDVLEDCQPAPMSVAVSVGGKLGYTADLNSTWTASPNSGAWSDSLRSVAAGLGKYVAVGDNEILLISNNGTSWTQISDPYPASTIDFMTVVYAGVGEWAAGGFDGTGSRILVSYNHGSSWENAGSPFGTGTTITGIGIHRDTGRWVAVGSPGDLIAYASRNARSTVGAWTVVDTISGSNPQAGIGFSSVAYHRGGWTAVGPSGIAATSADDGISWNYISPLCNGENLESLIPGSRQVIALGDQACVTISGSSRDLEWMTSTAVAPPLSVNQGLTGGYYDCGLDRWVIANIAGQVGYSDNGGATWNKSDTSAIFNASDIIAGVTGWSAGAVRAQIYGYSHCNPTGEDWDSLTPLHDVYIEDFNIPTNGDGKPTILGRATGTNFGMRLRAGLRITIPGNYTFRATLGSSDGVEVLLDGILALSAACTGNTQTGKEVNLTTGIHQLAVGFGDDGWPDALVLQYRGPDTQEAWVVVPASALVRLF